MNPLTETKLARLREGLQAIDARLATHSDDDLAKADRGYIEAIVEHGPTPSGASAHAELNVSDALAIAGEYL